ncbi:hypothetical protein Cgig2_021835 [Carnegiea gigantea]|uniref:Uncharacterized protein n=1 Tax=Carnegiea gigantea TaxID=171969 RepID=A0A9Q1Q4B6_9CARY|nr:hypothetical protein Cgig2_021835 [Carnegiea gigantea]
MYAAECDEKDDQTRGVTKKAKSATHITLQPLSKMGEKNTQQPLISIGSGTGNGKGQGSSNGKDQGFGNDKGKSAAIIKPTILLSTNNTLSHIHMETTVNNNIPNDEGGTSSVIMKRKRNPNARPRGTNLVKEVARLKDGEKLGVEFYNNGVVGDNSKAFSRHLGKLVRDRTMCPTRVHSWDEIQPEYLETMWAVVLFKGAGIENHKVQVRKHMRKLWRSW